MGKTVVRVESSSCQKGLHLGGVILRLSFIIFVNMYLVYIPKFIENVFIS
jgi:hypothetical protein